MPYEPPVSLGSVVTAPSVPAVADREPRAMAGSGSDSPDWTREGSLDKEEEEAPEKKPGKKVRRKKGSGKKSKATGQRKPKKSKRKASAVAETAVEETAAAEAAAADSIAPAEVNIALPHRLPPPPPPPNRKEHWPETEWVKKCERCGHVYDGAELWHKTQKAKKHYCHACYTELFWTWDTETNDQPLVKGHKRRKASLDAGKKEYAPGPWVAGREAWRLPEREKEDPRRAKSSPVRE